MSNESDNELYIAFEHGAESRESEIESLRQQLSGANARIELMGETALNQQKREVLLRVKLSEIAWSNDSKWQSDCAKEALAATDDLNGLIVCNAEPVAWIDFHNRRDIENEVEVGFDEPECRIIFDTDVVWKKPLYRAWEPK